jgi:hypothetical protein
MGEDDEHVAQDRLLELLAERQGSVPPERRAELHAEIAALAAVLGLEVSELDALTPGTVEAERKPPALMGRFRIMRRGRDIMPFVLGLVLAPMISALGEPEIAAAGLGVVVVGWFAHGRRRAAVFVIDHAGRMQFRRHGLVEWTEVDRATFRYRYPWMSVKGSLERAAGETALVRIYRRGQRPLRLAQGQLFQIKPKRQPISYRRLSGFLREQAKASGMTVQPLRGKKGAWSASRSA